MPTYATLTGRVVVPGTTTGIPGELKATPLTEGGVLTLTGDNYTTVGAAVAEVTEDGIIEQEGTPGLKIPTEVGGIVWRIVFHPKGKGNLPVRLGDYEVTTSTDLADLVGITPLAISPTIALQIEQAAQIGTTIDSATASFFDDADSDTYRALQSRIAAETFGMAALDDLAESVLLTSGTVSATTSFPVCVALGPAQVEQLALVFTTAVAASDTNYWTVTVHTRRNAVPHLIATKTTKTIASGGEAMKAFQEWNFDLVTFDADNATLNKGDVLTVTFTPTGSPAALTGPMVSYRLAPSAGIDVPTYLAWDGFDRSNSTGLGTAPTGQTWTSTAWNVVSSMAQNTGTGTAVLDAGVSDGTVSADLVTAGSDGTVGLVFRYTDANNYWGMVTNNIFKRVAGVVTNLTTWTPSIVAGYEARVVLFGNTITVYRKNLTSGTEEQLFTVTDSFNATATSHGLRASGSLGGHRVNNFRVYQ